MPHTLELRSSDGRIEATMDLLGFTYCPSSDLLHALYHAELVEITNRTDEPFSISRMFITMGEFEIANTRLASCEIVDDRTLRCHTCRKHYDVPADPFLDFVHPLQLPYLRAHEAVMGIVLFLHPKNLENEYFRLYRSQAPFLFKVRIAGTDTILQAQLRA